ncbi:MAG: hypothetical protein AAFP89_20320 [Bacteroidota bacterium]
MIIIIYVILGVQSVSFCQVGHVELNISSASIAWTEPLSLDCQPANIHFNANGQEIVYLRSLNLNVIPGGSQLTGVPSQSDVETAAGDNRAFLEYLYDFEDGHYLRTHLQTIPFGSSYQQRRIHVTGKYSTPDSIPDDPERSANTGMGNLAPNDRFTDSYMYIDPNRSVVPTNSITFALSFQEFNGIKPDGFFFLYNHSMEEGPTFEFRCADAYRGESSVLRPLGVTPLYPPTLEDYGLVGVPQEVRGYGEAVEFTGLKNSLTQVGYLGGEHTVFVTLNSEVDLGEEGQSALVAAVPYYLQEVKKGVPARKIPLEVIVAPQPVARAHDPNYIVVDRSFFIHGVLPSQNIYPNCVDLTYKAHFQNIGTAPATRVDIDIPIDNKLQSGSFQLLDWSPKVPLRTQDLNCADEEPFLYYEVDCNDPGKLHFSFHNVRIEGTKDQGADPRRPTTGWVKYKIKTLPISQNSSLFETSSTVAQADIIFYDDLGQLPIIQTEESTIDLRAGDYEYYGNFMATDAMQMNQYYPLCGDVSCNHRVTPCGVGRGDSPNLNLNPNSNNKMPTSTLAGVAMAILTVLGLSLIRDNPNKSR